jgi:hypothetical protein
LLHFKRYGHALALNIRRTPKRVQVMLNLRFLPGPPTTTGFC